MSANDLPKDPGPLSAWAYWQESLAAWTDYSQQTTEIMVSQFVGSRAKTAPDLDQQAETLAGELLRSLSDLNLRHWQNTARFLEGLPGWMQGYQSLTGSALVDWFDNIQRDPPATKIEDSPSISPPDVIPAPDGPADDLTLIKGIGPKLSAQLNALGIYHFRQIASWTDAEVAWVDEYLRAKGRISRDEWVSQASTLGAGGATVH